MNKVLVFTGSRGEWGYLRPILSELQARGQAFDLAVTNMHVDENYGATETEISADGFEIDFRIPMSLSFVSKFKWAHCLGYLASQIPNIIEQSKPELILLAGDRAETTLIASICYYADIPICHIQAGELSGHKDGLARHAIGKFAHIHFASNGDAAERLLRLGEEPFRVYQTGAPQLDDILDDKFVKSGSSVTQRLRLKPDKPSVIVIYHGSADEAVSVSEYVKPTQRVIQDLKLQQIWVLPNSDKESQQVETEILLLPRNDTSITRSLPRAEFAYLMNTSIAIVGNSSVGILEAPAVGLPSINIGSRQTGRYQSASVTQMATFDADRLRDYLQSRIKDENKKNSYFEYGAGDSAIKIADILTQIDPYDRKILNKRLIE